MVVAGPHSARRLVEYRFVIPTTFVICDRMFIPMTVPRGRLWSLSSIASTDFPSS